MDDAFTGCRFRAVARFIRDLFFFYVSENMANLHRIRESIVLAYFSNIINDDEFVLLYDANRPKNPDFNYKDHDQFDLDDYNDSECKANFR